jgi:hypothetical protein
MAAASEIGTTHRKPMTVSILVPAFGIRLEARTITLEVSVRDMIGET